MKKAVSAEAQLELFIGRYTPEVASLAKAALARMREWLPGATELVYDNYNALAIGFGPSSKATEAVFSIGLYPRWVNLYFLHGAHVPDPDGILRGSGKHVRSVKLTTQSDLDAPKLCEAVKRALQHDGWTPDASSKRTMEIRCSTPNQRPRTPR